MSHFCWKQEQRRNLLLSKLSLFVYMYLRKTNNIRKQELNVTDIKRNVRQLIWRNLHSGNKYFIICLGFGLRQFQCYLSYQFFLSYLLWEKKTLCYSIYTNILHNHFVNNKSYFKIKIKLYFRKVLRCKSLSWIIIKSWVLFAIKQVFINIRNFMHFWSFFLSNEIYVKRKIKSYLKNVLLNNSV